MSNSSIENKILGLLDRLRTENSSRDRDPLARVMDTAATNHPSSRNHRPIPTLGNLNTAGTTPTRRSRLDLPISFQERNIDATETDNKLKEIMKISGILTIGGVKYHTDISDMEHLGELGFGTCGQVVKMMHKPSGAIIAVKQMRRSGNSEENKRIIMDIDVVLKSHDCPYIVQCLGCFITDSDVWICMELMATCFDKLLKRLKRAIPENVLGKVTHATVKALSYLKEQHDVIHRDVKPSNILVDERGNVKLCDFGISGRLVDSMAKTRSAGCAAYMAPERIEPPNPSKPDYDIRADVWSLGITLVELATGVFPYRDCKTDFEVLTKVLSEDPPSLPEDQDFTEEFRAFVACCLIKNYVDRPKYAKLLDQPFLRLYETLNVNVEEWFKNALKQADLLGANSPGRRYTPAPSTSTNRRHIQLQQQQQQLTVNGGSVGPPPHTSLPPRHHPNHQQHSNNQRSPDKTKGPPTLAQELSGRFSPFQRRLAGDSPPEERPARVSEHYSRRLGESPPDRPERHSGRFSPSPRRHDPLFDQQRLTTSQNSTPVVSPYQQRRSNIITDGFWQSPISSPLPLRKHYSEAPQYNHVSNTSPILLQRFYHQQKQYQQQQHQQQQQLQNQGKLPDVVDPQQKLLQRPEGEVPVKEESNGKKRFASHIKLQLVGDRIGDRLGDRSSMKGSRHQSPEPPPRLSRGSSTEMSLAVGNQSPLALRRNFLEAGAASPSLSRRYISPSPPQPPPRRLSESSSVPGSPQHFRARFHYTPEPQRRVFHPHNTDVS